jgi:Uma2 family endonuclease
MSALQKKRYITEQEYLAFEEASDIKHEYVNGEIYALENDDGEIHGMAGTSENHNLITGNLFFHLRAASRGKGGKCKVFASDMKLRTEDGDAYYYPDVMLTCNDNRRDEFYKNHPCFIAEVLSKSTRTIDRREKWETYQKIPSLRYYLLVDSLQQKIDYFVRDDKGEWFYAELEDGEMLTIECDDYHAVLTLADIYEDVIF